MVDSQVDSTRVFVKGLPPSFTSENLANHFGKQYQVTDAHVFPDRRIGFVGFHDHGSAQSAVQFFHRSYIRMSRISVDLAKPVQVKRDMSGQAVPVSQRNTAHATKYQSQGTPDLAGIRERYLQKRKRDKEDDGEIERNGDQHENSAGNPQIALKVDNTVIAGDKEVIVEDQDIVSTKSDTDWLRGKTNRILDLIEPRVASEIDTEREHENQFDPGIMTQPDSQDIVEEQDNVSRVLEPRIPNGRLFLRNLAFDVTDADLQDRFGRFGRLQEAHIVRDPRTLSSKGIAFLQFSEPGEAENALKSMDGDAFCGRLLHILPASDRRAQGLTDYDISKMPLKKQKAIKRRMEAGTAAFSWNSLYMNPDAVISSIADRLGVSKAQILDPTSSDAAVKQAHAETQLITETKDYLRAQGISIDAFKNKQRDDKVILLKNFPYGTSEDDLRTLLSPFGLIAKFVFPPAGTMAVVQFVEPSSVSQALRQLAYKNIKGSVLYLEKAPKNLFEERTTSSMISKDIVTKPSEPARDNPSAVADSPVTLFIRNLNFATTSTRLTEIFSNLPGFVSARVKTRVDPKRPDEVLSMGFGFVEFRTSSSGDVAISTMNSQNLDGHRLIVQLSKKNSDLAEERRKEDNAKKRDAAQTKIIIKNLPFQASKKDIRSLFAQYGQLKTIRMPKKFDNTSRGFGFAEFVTAKEAQNAMDALADTHLLGRRLVLQFAEQEEIDPEEQIQAMERKTEQQSNRIQLSKLTGTVRKKFAIGVDEQDG